MSSSYILYSVVWIHSLALDICTGFSLVISQKILWTFIKLTTFWLKRSFHFFVISIQNNYWVTMWFPSSFDKKLLYCFRVTVQCCFPSSHWGVTWFLCIFVSSWLPNFPFSYFNGYVVMFHGELMCISFIVGATHCMCCLVSVCPCWGNVFPDLGPFVQNQNFFCYCVWQFFANLGSKPTLEIVWKYLLSVISLSFHVPTQLQV